MSGIARVLDCDGTITDATQGTLLEILLKDYVSQQNLIKKMNYYTRAILLKTVMSMSRVPGRIKGKKGMTGETTSLRACDFLLIEDMQIPFEFVKEKSEQYANLIKPKYKEAILSCEEDIYIVTSGPKQIVYEIARKASIAHKIKKIYGPTFEIKDGIILGFREHDLFAGVRGKYYAMEKVTENGHELIHAIGDSTADVGLFDRHAGKIVPYTFAYAPEELQQYVKEHGGKIVNSLDEFFS